MKRQPRHSPCRRDCPDRQATCHDTCERYLEWKQYRMDEKSALVRENHMGKVVEDMHAASVRRSKNGVDWKRRQKRG